MHARSRIRPILVLLLVLTPVACGDDPPIERPFRWVQFPYGTGDVVNGAVYEPIGPAKGVVLVFPWGQGFHEQTTESVDAYWYPNIVDAGYAVIGFEWESASVPTLGRLVLPVVLEWIDLNLPDAAHDVVFAGASYGGVAAFQAALLSPGRVGGIVGIPGAYTGDEDLLNALQGVPVLLMVGADDRDWITDVELTHGALGTAGASSSLEILPDQGHEVTLPDGRLLQWLNGR